MNLMHRRHLKPLTLGAFILGLFVGSVTVYAATIETANGPQNLAGTYVNARLGYTIQYPETWHTYTIPSMSYMRVENIDARTLKPYSEEARNGYLK